MNHVFNCLDFEEDNTKTRKHFKAQIRSAIQAIKIKQSKAI